MNLLDDKRRLGASEFAAASLFLLPFWVAFCAWICELWTSAQRAVGLPIVPEWLLSFYTPGELAFAPFFDGAVLYSLIVLWLKLKNYPEELDGNREAILSWRIKLQKRYSFVMSCLAVLILAFVLARKLLA